MGKWPNFEYHGSNDSNMIDLVLTHLTHPWGPPWTLATLGDMLENYHFGGSIIF